MTRRHVGTAIAESLAAHNVQRAYLVPGESFLPVLDGLYDSPIEAIVTRQEALARDKVCALDVVRCKRFSDGGANMATSHSF